MPLFRTPTRLHRLLWLDASICAASAVLLVLGARPIATLTQLPQALLFTAGLVLFPVAIYMGWVATRRNIPAPLAWPVLAGNTAWVAASVLLLISDWIAPNALGVTLIAVQALAVAGLTALEHAALHPRTLACTTG